MADMDEDAPINSLHNQPNDDNEEGDETQDFRLLASLSSKTGSLPKRGEKDFEPHGTQQQDGVLAASRQAMHDALDYTRFHLPKAHVRAFYYGEGVGKELERDELVAEEWRKGLEPDHVIVVEGPRGPHFRTIGRANEGKHKSSLWLLPEEALYLVERGNLDLWWPNKSSYNGVEDGESEKAGQSENGDDGVPMSLQAAYAMLIGLDGERGKISLERYNVYANLKRNGYVVMRGPDWDPNVPTKPFEQGLIPGESKGMFTWLYDLFAKDITHSPYGPLVKPGLYRSYDSIYRQMAIIPRYKPSPVPDISSQPPSHPFRVCFHIWKPSSIPTFAKTNPGLPDFRIAIVDARETFVPTLPEVVSLFESSPWDPPGKTMEGPNKMYHRIRHGYRNVILAVNDQGIISYLRMGDCAFGEEKLYERFDEGNSRGNKRGGRRGRGGGRWRGRGRGGK
ncbi:hypothetical protein BELL_0195g00020 [Botrytis elliptica]|uniref:tRNA-splicing endonuclease subunit Sen54 N-terminal domain-containing protein n=1 Tax=Botrytis elliptica TaxID=278938 RepID=A0A4Z1JQV8_9HELO|nr:hypothetical protein EAE99_006614 [Botrytis elliptica]TGO75734.1 hypothetical protein BELL_0195g00020 [Botrytis elliptica]